ncbi:MAG: PAS domain S-box protein [Anaerolineales bacterium]|nr:PAS domain S-box protein [Anaerolineales bacterium]
MPATRVPLQLLQIEASPIDAQLARAALRQAGYDVAAHRVETAAELEQALRGDRWDAVLADFSLPGLEARLAFEVLRQAEPELPVIVVSAGLTEEQAAAALRAGVHDVIAKDALDQLAAAIERLQREAAARRQRRQVQWLLGETEEIFLQVWETTPEAMALTDAEGLVLAANPAYHRLFGFTPEQTIGQSFTLGLPEARSAATLEQYRRVFSGEEPLDAFEALVQRADGGERWVESRATFLTRAGQRLAMLSIIRDVTEHRQAEAALRASEERLRTTMDTMLDGAQVIGFDWRYLYVNVTAAAHGRVPREALLGKTMMEAYPGIDQTLMFATLRECMQQRLARQMENEFTYPDGSRGWFELSIQPVPEGLFVLSRDISERKRADAQIQRQLEQLQALRIIDQAIASSLDLRVTLDIFLEQVTSQLAVDAAGVMLLESPGQVLVYAAGRGFRSTSLEHARVRLGEGRAGRAALQRRAVIETGPAPRTGPLGEDRFAFYYGVPLVAKGQVLGVLEIHNRTPLQPDRDWLNFLEALTGQVAIAIENATLFAGLQRTHQDLVRAYDATIEGWSRALDLRDRETEGHSRRVTELTLLLGRATGMRSEELVHVRRGALLHDIGKLGVPDAILRKPGPLTAEEWSVMYQHPVLAFELLAPIAYLGPALDIPYSHHEKWDGSGYPRGLAGEQIPLAARLFAVADVWDALRSERPYRPAWPEVQVRQHIRTLAGRHFDPRVVEIFLKLDLSEIYPPRPE